MEDGNPSKIPLTPRNEEIKVSDGVNEIKQVSPSSSTTSAMSLIENVEHKSTFPFPPFPQLREPVFVGLTKRQLLILTAVGLTEFFGAMLYSIHGPFFPKEASRKGISASQFGFSFGAFELVALLMCPIFGKLLRNDSIMPNLLYHLGVFTAAFAAILFSMLGFAENATVFLIGSIVLRAIEGAGEAAFITASFTLIADEFPDTVATTFSSMQTFFGLGLVCGPVMAGALHDALFTDDMRFTLTFGVFGVILLLSGIVGLLILPKNEINSHELGGRKSIRGFQVLSLLRIGSVRLAVFSILSAAISIGFLSTLLELHLRSFSIHPVLLGGLFAINGGLYAISAPAWGWVLDRFGNPKYFILFGSTLIIEGFLLIGPAEFIPLDTTILWTCVGLALQGLGLGAVLVSAFNLSLTKAVAFGYEANIVTYGIVTSLWMSFFSLGSFVGSSVSGFLFDSFGFRASIWLVLGFHLLLVLVTILSIWNTRNSGYSNKVFEHEYKPLLYASPKPSTSRSAAEAQHIKYGATQA